MAKAWDTVEREILEFISEVDSPIRIDYGFNYKGTLPLDFETFPAVSVHEENNGTNVKTAFDTDDLDNPTKWILYPTKKDGQNLSSEEVDQLLEQNEHFGIYNTYNDMMEADSNIKNHFKDLENLNSKLKEGPQIRIVDKGDISGT